MTTDKPTTGPACPICGKKDVFSRGQCRTIAATLTGWGIEGEIIQTRRPLAGIADLPAELEKTRLWWERYKIATGPDRLGEWNDDTAATFSPGGLLACDLKDCIDRLNREMREPFKPGPGAFYWMDLGKMMAKK